MLCATCRRQLAPATVCGACGTPAPGASPPLDLVLSDGTRVPLVADLTIGRSRASSLWLDDPSVSRRHARIVAGADGDEPLLEDASSSYGTFVDDGRVTAPTPLRDGAKIRIGNQRLEIHARRADTEAGRTIVVPMGASLLLPAAGAASLQVGAEATGQNPRLRSGYALKRLDASEGERRWIVRDLNGETFLRVSENDAQLLKLLDGSHSLADLVGEAETAFGPTGMARLARLLADVGERGMLAGVAGGAPLEDEKPKGWRRLVRTRERSWDGIGRVFGWVYEHGGWLLFTRPARIALSALAVIGTCVWVVLIAGRYGTPFVVADRLVLGGLVFLVGRTLLVALHELAHGLTMESMGRRVRRGGLKLIVVFPYAFVDTSEVWFEPRRRRMAVAAAGPFSDLALGGLFSILCLTLPDGTVRDILFQLAFAAYVSAFFNLNPFIDRDGYHIISDRLQVSGLRTRARQALRDRLSGRRKLTLDPALQRYAWAGVGWSLFMAGGVTALSLIYQPLLARYAPSTVVWIVLVTLWVALLIPVFIAIGPPLVDRVRGRFRGRGGGQPESAGT